MGAVLEAEIDEGKKLEGISEAFTRALGSLRNAADFAVAFREQTHDLV